MMSPCRWGVMSQRGLERVVRELRAGVRNRRRIDALLVASLLTGRRATDLDAMPMRKEKRASERARAQGRAKDRHRDEEFLVHRLDYMALRTGLGLPAPPARERPDYYRTAEPLVDLPLPSEVLECLRNRGPQPRFDEERFAERARELRTTPARIRGAGHLWLYHSGHDRTVLSRLFGEDLARATPLYYENMAHEKVLGAYAAWYGHINAQLPGHEFRIKRKERELHVGVGSRRVPEAKVVANLLRKHRDFVSGLLERPRELVRAHDHYAAYTHLVLSLATGLRSVRHPFETINHFCWETSTYFIQDKNVGGNPSPRYVPLAQFAVEQLSHYLAYLSWLQTRLSAYPRRGEYVEAALQGQVPYLFSLDQHPADPRPLAPNLIRNTLEGISHLVPNWPRHFLRSALAARGVRDDVLQALLGHGDMGQEPFARYSALTTADLKDAADQIQALGGELGVKPLAHPKAGTSCIRQGKPTKTTFDYMHRHRKRLQASREKRRGQVELGRAWVAERVQAIQEDLESWRNQSAADEWQERALADLDELFKGKFEWLPARRAWAKAVDALNERHKLAIPVRPAPHRPVRTPLMHDEPTFLSRRAVRKAAAGFITSLDDPQSIASATDESLLALTAFSAACFGGLADPKALLAFACEASTWDGRTPLLSFAPAPLHLCWVACLHETPGAANVVVDGKPLRLRRFFPDGMTLVLLVRYLDRRRTERNPVGCRKRFSDQALMGRIQKALAAHCDASLPKGFTLAKLCTGAVGVAECQPGVRLPHYLAEYAAGRITSVSLPEAAFRAYLGRTHPPAIDLPTRQSAEPRPAPPPADSRPDPTIDEARRHVRRLFVSLPEERLKAKETLVRRMDELLSSGPAPTTRLLVDWLRDLISRPAGPLAVTTARRYSDWIATGWLTQFEGVDLEALDAEDWHQRYRQLLELEEEHNRSQVAGRISQFHQYLCRTHGFEPLPADQQFLYSSQRFVRAQVVPERLFSAFVDRLSHDLPDARQGECVRWIFTFCYRLGTRIGETTRLRMSDIERGRNPVVHLRANRFGTTKTKKPHQLPLRPFLPEVEWQGFQKWLAQRREIAREDSALVFGKDDSPNLLWDQRELARLFTKAMYELSGEHFTPHALRHSAASRLIWIAEDEAAPDGSAYTDAETELLKRAVFTAQADCRDRVWHLSAVFNHSGPSTTLESYVHFLDLLLHRKLSRSQRRFSPQVLERLLELPRRQFSTSEFCNSDGFPIERILPVVFESNEELFEVLEPAPASVPTAPTAPAETAEARRPMRYRLAQPMLEDIENGLGAEAIAICFGVKVDFVEALAWSASQLAALTTSHGLPRLFSKRRLERVQQPLSPTRVKGISDQRLFTALMPLLESERGEQRRERIREACIHFLNHVTTADSGLPFHTPDALRRFLDVFLDLEREPISRDRWLVLVKRVRRRRDDQLRAWRVHDGICVEYRTFGASDSTRFPDGVAHLYLQVEGDVQRAGARKETSKAMKHLMHTLSILMLAEDFLEHGEHGVTDWPLRQSD